MTSRSAGTALALLGLVALGCNKPAKKDPGAAPAAEAAASPGTSAPPAQPGPAQPEPAKAEPAKAAAQPALVPPAPVQAASSAVDCRAVCAKQLDCARAPGGTVAGKNVMAGAEKAVAHCMRACAISTKGPGATNFHAVAACQDQACGAAFSRCMATQLKANAPPSTAPSAPGRTGGTP